MKSGTLTLEKEYIELVDMTPREVSQWLNTLVTGLMKKRIDGKKTPFKEDSE